MLNFFFHKNRNTDNAYNLIQFFVQLLVTLSKLTLQNLLQLTH